jgi:hypothetical protein
VHAEPAAPGAAHGSRSDDDFDGFQLLLVFVVEGAPEGGYSARALDASIFTEADTLGELRTQVRDAVRCHFDEGRAPKVIRLHFVRDEVISA